MEKGWDVSLSPGSCWLLIVFNCSTAEQNSWHTSNIQQVSVTQGTSGHPLGIQSGQGLVPVGDMNETTFWGGKKDSAYEDMNWTVLPFGLRARDQAQPTVFGGIGTATDVFN